MRFYILYDARCTDEVDMDKANVLVAIGHATRENAFKEAREMFPNCGAILWSYEESETPAERGVLINERCEGPIDT